MEGWINGQVEGLCLIMLAVVNRVFGHISYRSDWELVKVDFRQSFPRQCTEADYDSWKLTDLQVISGCFSDLPLSSKVTACSKTIKFAPKCCTAH